MPHQAPHPLQTLVRDALFAGTTPARGDSSLELESTLSTDAIRNALAAALERSSIYEGTIRDLDFEVSRRKTGIARARAHVVGSIRDRTRGEGGGAGPYRAAQRTPYRERVESGSEARPLNTVVTARIVSRRFPQEVWAFRAGLVAFGVAMAAGVVFADIPWPLLVFFAVLAPIFLAINAGMLAIQRRIDLEAALEDLSVLRRLIETAERDAAHRR